MATILIRQYNKGITASSDNKVTTSYTVPTALLRELFAGPQSFTAKEVAGRMGIKPQTAYRWLYSLQELGWVEIYTKRLNVKGHREAVWRRTRNLVPSEPEYTEQR